MESTLDEQINQLKKTIAEMDSQRAILGNETVDAALVPLHKKLAELESQVELSVITPPEIANTPTQVSNAALYGCGWFDCHDPASRSRGHAGDHGQCLTAPGQHQSRRMVGM